jgi:23S rRNA (guanosine2251-2'-O)-methyltransferase
MARERTTGSGLVVYGLNAVEALLRSANVVERVVIAGGRGSTTIATLARARRVAVEEADRATLDRLAGHPHHQGAVAFSGPYRYADVEDVAEEQGGLLVLDSVQDPRNLGAILRTARGAGVSGVVLPQDRSVGVTPVVVASSAGCLFGLRIARVPNLVRAMEALKAKGNWLVGLVPSAERSLYALPAVDRPALVVGGEGEGLRPLVRRTCDFEASLPMAPGVESLNVSVATGIALYELLVRPRVGG